MGHSSAETTWKHYVHIFEDAKRGRAVPMEEAIAAGPCPSPCPVCPGRRRHVRLVVLNDETPPAVRGLSSARGRIRTCDFWLRRPALYPLSYARSGR